MKKNTKKNKLITVMVLWLSMILAMPVHGDDTEIYGGGTSSNVDPNVLIIFDTSGSMEYNRVSNPYKTNNPGDMVPNEEYDPERVYTYSGMNLPISSYGRDEVFYATANATSGATEWKPVSPMTASQRAQYTNNIQNEDKRSGTFVQDIGCAAIREALLADGVARGAMSPTSPYGCGGETRTFATGNWVRYNTYEPFNTLSRSVRMDVAQKAVTDLVSSTTGVRFGLMRFTTEGAGGTLVTPIADMDTNAKNNLNHKINGLVGKDGTPLARTLMEAGRYFAGKKTMGFSTETRGVTYTTPIDTTDYFCRKNYIILMTDGEPSPSGTSTQKVFLNDKVVTTNNANGVPDLADIAGFLYENDVLGDSNQSGWKQNVVTYTIGFASIQDLLARTAEKGGGEYYSASTAAALANAFQSIITKIKESNAVFVSPVVPVSQHNRTFAGNYLYVGFFKPNPQTPWDGNIKKYVLKSDGTIADVNGNPATDASTGAIVTGAKSVWSTGSDGPIVTKGGAGGVLQSREEQRNLYTITGAEKSLVHADNAFSLTNAKLTSELLGVVEDADGREKTINAVVAGATQNESGGWRMGDVLHSTPAVVTYDNGTYIFTGTNRGVLHAFNDATGKEEWGFVPGPQLKNLKNLWKHPSIKEKNYFVDGAPAVYDGTLIVGERRGGSNYYVLDVSTISQPKYKYTIGDPEGGGTLLGTPLGQSWANPTVHKMKTDPTTSTTVFLMAGGYDDKRQDLLRGKSDGAADDKGKAVFTIKVDEDSLALGPLNSASLTGLGITNCIVDTTGIDSNDDAHTDRVYAGDLGGHIWAFEDHGDPHPEVVKSRPVKIDGNWSGKLLFSDDGDRKIFYAPDVVLETSETGNEDMIFFGTGDRAAPKDTSVKNRIYAVKNNWNFNAPSEDVNLTPDDLYDANDNRIQQGSSEDKTLAGQILKSKRGWFFDLEHRGEKVISSVLVYNGVLYFTTYTPASNENENENENEDPCGGSTELGTARLYAVDYKNGAAVINFDTTDPTVTTLNKDDRSTIIGDAIPSSPVIAVLAGKSVLFVGISGGIATKEPLQDKALNRFYWKMPLE
ncbi:hypothetical protein LJC22_01280 [Desulfosarcina sp. OttesenSCG-928-G10]|nr:hypothetical protein [Desulfosarcina sp. OttesenSCG-928-G10]MDL2320864.1 hypothetical protein [Desulfosarcina sp. OttesenSCG-928-B08]